MFFSSLLLPALGLAANAHVLKLREHHPAPRGWSKIQKASPDHQINLQIGLKQSNFGELERHLFEVSDPSHARYGQHLKEHEVNQLIRPTEKTSNLVHEWLESYDINATESATYSPARDWIRVVLPVSAIERMLDADYHIYRHPDGAELVRSTSWSLPEWLHEHISTIQPTNSFFRATPKSTSYKTVRPITDVAESGWGSDPEQWPGQAPDYGSSTPDVSKVCNVSAVTPTCLRTLYGTINYKVQEPVKNQVALNNFLGEANNRSDVSIFLKKYRPDAASAAYSFNTIVINKGDNQQTPDNATQLAAGKDLEGNLDAETIIGITYPMKLTTYNTGGEPPFKPDVNEPTNGNEPYMVWLDFILAQPDAALPHVISTSYGDDEQTVPPSYADTVCKQMAQLGARGVSILFASGDSGVGGNGTCVSNDGKNTTTFVPSFPPTCPYVTAVGATYKFNPEVVAYDARNGFSSGGGFSNYFAQPAYQKQAVDGYLNKIGNIFPGLYNKSGRAYPDIAAQGERFITVWNGSVVLLDGTSASTPTASSIIALVNDALVAAGKPPLGFLNPWLYAGGYKAFTDVTSGSAIGCDTAGFPAEQGWDAVTGFGTPYFPKIVADLLKGKGRPGGYGPPA